jgi:hypothetical protein
MKLIITAFLLISNLASFAQSNQLVGDYNLTLGKEGDHLFEYQLTLDQDGTFFFHYYSKIKLGLPPEKNKYGKGKWTVKNNVVSFFSDKEKDFDEKHTLDFNNSKARFVSKSPRDKTDRLIKTSLRFIESEISWMKGINVLKI